jgi:transcriptional regulator with XRE-family HTH domain
MHGLKDLRERRLITQEELASASGLTVATVSRLERGKAKPTLKTIRRLAKALEVNPQDLREILISRQATLNVDESSSRGL